MKQDNVNNKQIISQNQAEYQIQRVRDCIFGENKWYFIGDSYDYLSREICLRVAEKGIIHGLIGEIVQGKALSSHLTDPIGSQHYIWFPEHNQD